MSLSVSSHSGTTRRKTPCSLRSDTTASGSISRYVRRPLPVMTRTVRCDAAKDIRMKLRSAACASCWRIPCRSIVASIARRPVVSLRVWRRSNSTAFDDVAACFLVLCLGLSVGRILLSDFALELCACVLDCLDGLWAGSAPDPAARACCSCSGVTDLVTCFHSSKSSWVSARRFLVLFFSWRRHRLLSVVRFFSVDIVQPATEREILPCISLPRPSARLNLRCHNRYRLFPAL